jgi:hypothetical protein
MHLGGWAGWAAPIAALLLVGIAATVYLQRIRLPREESAAGVASLAAMRWRDFIHLVLDALLRRGYERVFEPGDADEEGDYVLERNGQRFLLSSKHGAAYVLGSTAIAEFAAAIRMRGAAGGLLVTPGQFAAEARPLARAQRIELLDGLTLWPELRPLLTAEQRTAISAPLKLGLHRRVALVWMVVAALAVLIAMLGQRNGTESAAVTSTLASPPPSAAASARPAAAPAADVDEAPTDPEALERRRTDVAKAISALPEVDRALWQTQSTLLVYLQDGSFDPLSEICPELERYEELAATRLQLQPPPGSPRPVRFVQCRPY